MIVIVLIALALPVGIVVWALVPKRPAAEPEPEGLRQALEAIADTGLPGGGLELAALEARLEVVDAEKSAAAISEVAAGLGGTTILAESSEKGVRILATLPAGAHAEFLRRVGLLTGGSLPEPPVGEESPLVTIDLVETGGH